MKLLNKIIVACAAIFLFSACEESENCKNSEIQISAKIPAGSQNIAENFPPTESEKIISANGFFISKNEFLTVAHFLPRGAKIEDFSEKKRDEKSDSLLLKSQKCGIPLLLKKENLNLGDEIFECDSGKSRGKITEIKNTVSENTFGETILLENLFFVSGSFELGESGKPFCNHQKEVIGIFVARNSEGGFLQVSEKIQEFLN